MFGGKNVTVAEDAFHNDLCNIVGCICCRQHYPFIDTGEPNTHCSIHHIDGRTKHYAHWYVLPLCGGHHQEGSNTAHPWILAVHPKGRSKSQFEEKYGTEEELWLQCFEIIQYIPPEVKDWLSASL